MKTKTLLEMLTYKRPEGTVTQTIFCERFIEPVFGDPDRHGNYIHMVYNPDGSEPNVCFTAHHDTVHKLEGLQKVTYDKHLGVAYVESSNCLGADCTTGIWLILGMIEAKVPGVYVIHAAEEVGCLGSEALIKDKPDWLWGLDAVISFDRYGTKSVITHQMGLRTASDEFAESLAGVLGLEMEPDPYGAYTDSNEYIRDVSECTNLSVGYYDQHTPNEHQDINFARVLLDALVSADWSKLVFLRDRSLEDFYDPFRGEPETLEGVVYEYGDEVAELLESWGYSAEGLLEDIGYMKNSKRYIG